MSAQADHHLRRLIENARSIDDAISRLDKPNSHQLGLGITPKRSYGDSTAKGRIALPTFGAALDALKKEIAKPVLNLDERDSRAMWSLLLNKPGAAIPMPSPGSPFLEAHGINATATQRATLRQLLLVVVAKPDKEWDASGELTRERIAGVGLLTVAPENGGPSSEMAWLEAHWGHSTREFVSILEPFYDQAGLGGTGTGVPVTILFDGGSGANDVDSALATVRATASVTGLDVKGLILTPATHQNVAQVLLKRDRPSHLITVGNSANMAAIVESFESTPTGRTGDRVSRVETDVPPFVNLRELFVRIAGVSAGLQAVRPPTQILRMPITPVACLHGGGFIYVQDRQSGLWWTRDKDEHGGSRFKTYVASGSYLDFEADRDEAGVVILNKTKGEKRKRIRRSGLNPCSNPADEAHVKFPVPQS